MVDDLVVRGGTVVDGDGARRADVLVRDGRIVDVGEELEHGGARIVEADGAYVVPGGIDVHTHFALPVGAVTSADDFGSGTLAAACGGTTCVVDFAGAGREPWEEALATWHDRARGRAVVDYGFHLTVTELPTDPEAAAQRFTAFAEQGVTSVKLYLAYPDRLMVDDETLGRALVASRRTGVRVCVHAEDGATVEALVAEVLAAGRTGPDAIPSARPPSVEAEAIRRAAALAGAAGSWLYVVHLSSEAGLQAVRAARAAGVDVHTETCPHYLHLEQSHLEAGDPDFVCAPPLRRASDRVALWDALGVGDVEVVATDHCPFTTTDRRRGTGGTGWADFTGIPGGLGGVETRLSLVYQGVTTGRLSLERWVDATSAAPARLFGLDGVKGSVRVGLDADLVVFDPGATRRLDASHLHSRSDHSPYADLVVTGWPAVTISRGEVVAVGGEPTDPTPGRGRFVRRTPLATAPRRGITAGGADQPGRAVSREDRPR
ncbi:dihydropyrimidinase [Nocardioides sp.]|uniref:dihydropyrimidinase n=1 Tax=Nocardioides sp. TaxID=35761 RepID=UPI00378481AD